MLKKEQIVTDRNPYSPAQSHDLAHQAEDDHGKITGAQRNRATMNELHLIHGSKTATP